MIKSLTGRQFTQTGFLHCKKLHEFMDLYKNDFTVALFQ